MATQQQLPRLLTGSELLKLLRIENRCPFITLHRLRTKKGLPAIRAGRSYKYPLDLVTDWIRANAA